MRRFVWCTTFSALLACMVASRGLGQSTPQPTQNIVSVPTRSPSPVDTVEPIAEDSDAAIDPASLLPDLPSLPPEKASLIGGTIQKLDRVRDEITVQVFGGGKITISFDPRTHIYLGTDKASTSDLHRGDRIYVDTILDGSLVFAKNIRLKNTVSAGLSQGVVTSYRSDRGELVMRDILSPRALKVRLTTQTKIVHGDRAVGAGELVSGTLVSVKFGPEEDGRAVAREISVLAVPGSSLTFAGRVTSIDLRLGLIVLTSSTDNKIYEIHFDPTLLGVDDNLRPDANVTVQTRFDGSQYMARSITVDPSGQQ
jgi:hypothetical protein